MAGEIRFFDSNGIVKRRVYYDETNDKLVEVDGSGNEYERFMQGYDYVIYILKKVVKTITPSLSALAGGRGNWPKTRPEGSKTCLSWALMRPLKPFRRWRGVNSLEPSPFRAGRRSVC